MRSKVLRAAAAVVAAALYAGSAQAANVSFTGSFAADDSVQLFNFSVGALSTVTLRSYSYAGGIQANGNVVAAGGFDPILALFDGAGHFIGQNDDGAGVPADPVTGRHYDTLLQTSLAAGNYIVSVMEYNNFAVGANLSDGFVRDGQGNFTPAFTGCVAAAFCDVSGAVRTNQWAFDILNVTDATEVGGVSTVPIPAALPLLASALAWLGFFGYRRRSA